MLCVSLYNFYFHRAPPRIHGETPRNNTKTVMKKYIILLFILAGGWFLHVEDKRNITIGIVTDVQYCSCEPNDIRFYKNSIVKLDSSIKYFNSQKLDFIAHLGDVIDRDFRSYDTILPKFKNFHAPVYYILGNHEFNVIDSLKNKVLNKIGMQKDYYSKNINGWKFIFLNGDELSSFYPKNKSQQTETDSLFKRLKERKKCNATPWNGGISKEQFEWLRNELELAQQSNQKVIVLCHFPVYPEACLNLLNDDEVLKLFDNFKCVKAYFCGHNHEGEYGLKNGIHFITFKGMVETPERNSFAKVTLTADSIFVEGHGREPNRRLKIY